MARDDYTPNVADTAARVTEYYLNQALDRQNMVNTVMLNSTRQQYEKTVGRVGEELDRRLGRAQESLNAAAGGVILGSDDFQSAVRRCVSEMAEEGLTGFYDRSGREWSAQAYVTMDVRTTAANAAREAAMERNREYGNELIAVSSHPGARPLCEPYQGGVYSTDGSTGETQDLHGATISYYPLELTSYGEAAGLFGINCGHYPSPFIAGMSVVRKLDITHEENERLYKESQQQRYMERKVRAEKTKADALEAAGDKQGAKAARRSAREKNAELKAWCDEKGRAYYPERTRVVRAEAKVSFASTTNEPAIYSPKIRDTSKVFATGLTTSDAPSRMESTQARSDYERKDKGSLRKAYDKAVESGYVSALTGFKLYRKTARSIESDLLGVTTSEGITITGYKTHFIDRVIGSYEQRREPVGIGSIADALQHPTRIKKNRPEHAKNSDVYFGDECWVTINPDTCELIQVTPKRRSQ